MSDNLPEAPLTNSIVLVAGAAGFLGSHLTDVLITSGSRVVGLDDLISGSKQNIEHLKGHRQFDFIEANINKKLPKSLFSEPISHIVHVANIESYLGQEKLELNQLLTNSFGVKNLLDLAHVLRARFVFTSSLDIYYGIASSSSLEHYYDSSEDESRFSYLEAKRYAEALCQQYVDLYDLDIRIARLAEVYGPRMNLNNDSMLARLIRLVLDEKDLTIDEEGSREHLLCFVSDAAYGLTKLLFSNRDSVQKRIFNFANPEPVSTLSIAYVLRDLVGEQLKVEFIPAVKGFAPIKTRKTDITRSRRELYWEPKMDISDGLSMTLEWFIKRVPSYGKGRREESEKEWRIRKNFFETGTQDITQLRTTPVTPVEKKTKKGQVVSEEHGAKKATLPEKLSSFLQKLQTGWRQRAGKTKEKASEVEIHSSPVEEREAKGWLAQVQKIRPRRTTALKGVESRTLRGNVRKHMLVLASLIVLLFLTPIFLSGIFATATFFQLNQAQAAVLARNFDDAQEQLSVAQTNFLRTRRFFHYNRFLFYVFGQKSRLAELDTLMSAGFFVLDSVRFATLALEQLEPIYETFLVDLARSSGQENFVTVTGQDSSQEQKDLQSKLFEAELDLSVATKRLALAQAELKKINGRIKPCLEKTARCSIWDRWLTALVQKSNTIGVGLDTAVKLSGVAPALLGVNSPQRFLVLLQNNTELRATGGFLGSYAVFSFDRGRLTELKVDDIYNPDGLLKQKITAPEAVQKYMDVSELGIRDSNWWPHFPESAEKIITLYEFATNDKVDTVIALNLDVIKNLLLAIGPISLPKYDETITADNLFERAEVHSEVGFEPGSTQKQDFLANLTEAILSELSDLGPALSFEILGVISESLWQKEILLYSREEEVERVFKELGWSGGVDVTESDYLFVVDSNVGGNKANFWVTRKTDYELTVDRDGNLIAEMTVFWEHTGTSSTWPGGDYRNFLRAYVPLHSELIEEFGFMDTPVVYEEFGKRVLAGLMNVPVNSTHSVGFKYKLPKEVGFSEGSLYRLLIQKQSGVSEEHFSFKLSLPPFLKTVEEGPDEVVREEILNKDKEIIVEVKRS